MPRLARTMRLSAILFFSAATLSGCGYGFQTSKTRLSEKEHVEKVYVTTPVNNSFKAGVENVFYNALLRNIGAQGHLRLVQNAEVADAILSTTISSVEYVGGGHYIANNLRPAGKGPDDVRVATLYTASFAVSMQLLRRGGALFRPDTALRGAGVVGVPRADPAVKAEGLAALAGPNLSATPMPAAQAAEAANATANRNKSVTSGAQLTSGVIWSGSFNRSRLFAASNQVGVLGTTAPTINDSEFDRALEDLMTIVARDVNESMLSMF